MRNQLFAAIAFLALAAAPSFAAAETVDASAFNTSGPGVTSQLQPGLTFKARAHGAYQGEPRVATESVDATSFNTSGPGAANSLNAQARPASGFGVPAALANNEPVVQRRAATQAIDAATFNTAGPGEISGVNPSLTTAGHARIIAGKLANHS